MCNVYVHYGADTFDKYEDVVIEGKSTIKPVGNCLWASPVLSKISWKCFCESEKFNLEKLNKHFNFVLDVESNIYTIEKAEDLFDLINRFPGADMSSIESKIYSSPVSKVHLTRFPDYEAISKVYDGIEVSMSSDPRLYHLMYGWDVDSIVIWNLNVVDAVPEFNYNVLK